MFELLADEEIENFIIQYYGEMSCRDTIPLDDYLNLEILKKWIRSGFKEAILDHYNVSLGRRLLYKCPLQSNPLFEYLLKK